MRPTFFVALTLLAACDGGAAKDSDSNTVDDSGGSSTDCVEENGACVLSGTYTEDMTLTADKNWLLRSKVEIGDDQNPVTLTIEPGTTIYGEGASTGMLVITRGAKINAVGRADAPIVFTSDQPVGSRARGQWGGVVINGRAPINACADGTPDCEAEGEGGMGKYGGSDDADNSGTLKYVRIEFGGIEVSPDNEINGLSLQAVGSGTSIDYIQVHQNLDDGIEWWGGSVDVKHILVTGVGDDGLDWDFGYHGRVQYAVVHQAGDAGNNALEGDNNPDVYDAAPTSAPVFSHLTLIGSTTIPEDNFGILARRGTAGQFWNVAAMDFTVACLAIRDQETFDHYTAGDSAFAHTRFACAQPFEEDAEKETETVTEDQVFEDGTDNQIVDNLKLGSTDFANPNYQPGAGSPLLSGGGTPGNPFFDQVTYIGAFDGTTDWTAGWTTHALN